MPRISGGRIQRCWQFLPGLLIVLALSACNGSQSVEEAEAARQLESLLGQGEAGHSGIPDETPEMAENMTPNPFEEWLMSGLSNLGMESAMAQIKETEKAYIIEVPIKNPADEKNVSVQVEPNRIRVQGQVSFGGGGMSGSTSFMNSFTTNEAVDPNGVTRKTKADKLVITVPKRHPAASFPKYPQSLPPVKEERRLAPEVLEELDKQLLNNGDYI
jgi:HSP20 family molecular chaperone IbpA